VLIFALRACPACWPALWIGLHAGNTHLLLHTCVCDSCIPSRHMPVVILFCNRWRRFCVSAALARGLELTCHQNYCPAWEGVAADAAAA
jgi:hypothetical protein